MDGETGRIVGDEDRPVRRHGRDRGRRERRGVAERVRAPRPIVERARVGDRVDFAGVSNQVDAQLNIARRAVCKYRRIEAALADGYVNTGLACVRGQGFHYIKPSLVGTTDIRHPSVLMYTADGDLNSPEWVAPESDFPFPPSARPCTARTTSASGSCTFGSGS